MQNSKTIGIVGAGPVGSLLSLFLAKRGLRTEIYERRPDIRTSTIHAGRSINMAVSTRGLYALRQVGLESEILRQAVPMLGRMIHSPSGQTNFQRYGMNDSECIYSISRSGLNRSLLTQAEKSGLAHIHFEKRVKGVQLDSRVLEIQCEKTGDFFLVQHETVISTDGSSSIIRNEMMKLPEYQCHQGLLDYGYKELTIPPGPRGTFLMEKNALHIWPRGSFMLIALPNFDGSFTCTLFLPFKGKNGFDQLDDSKSVLDFFKTTFPDVTPLITDLADTFFSNPTGQMVTVKCSPWNYSGNLLLLGDAAHAIVPFFGQGMNCGFEDCSLFYELLQKYDIPMWNEVFSIFSTNRKPDADAIADLALNNFIEMRDKVGNSRFLLEKEVEKILQSHFPKEYRSLYSLVSFSRIPYQLALQVGKIENEILSELCNPLENAKDVDLQSAKALIQTKLAPHLGMHLQKSSLDY